MTDILVLFEKYKNMVVEFLDTKIEFELSWGQKRDFPTQDPFDNVRIRKDKIVIRQTISKDPIWIVDAVRGLLVAGIEVDTPSMWNFATLVALIMVPTSQITESRKTTYRRQWLAYKPYFTNHSIRYNYERWYKILSGFSRIKVLEILSEFVQTYHLDREIETKFNNFLLNMRETLYEEDDLNFIHTTLKHQELDYSLIWKEFGWSKAKYYRIKSRLEFTITKYYLPNYATLGLIRMYFHAPNQGHLAEYRLHPYYENFENFKGKPDVMYKFFFPLCTLDNLISTIDPSKLRTPIYLRLLSTMNTTVCPLMYDCDKQRWESVYEDKREIVKIPSLLPQTQQMTEDINSNDLLVLKGVLRARSTNVKKLGLELSQSITKRIIRKLQRNNFYNELVLWRRPSDLTTIGIFAALTDYIVYDGSSGVIVDRLQDFQNTDMSLSWPFQSTEIFIKLQTIKSQLTYRYVQFTQISGLETDIDRYISTLDNSEILGKYEQMPGSVFVIPDTEFDKGWKYDIDDFLSMIEIYS